MPECPLCKQTHAPACGLRLYNSENECPICLEKNSEMVALPCGHQFCNKDVQKIGFSLRPVATEPRIPLPPRPPIHRPTTSRLVRPISDYIRHVQSRRNRRVSRTTNRRTIRRRCGWCGHIGHTQRKCMTHRIQCGCITFKRERHKQLYKRKPLCNICGKRGHSYSTCHIVIRRS